MLKCLCGEEFTNELELSEHNMIDNICFICGYSEIIETKTNLENTN